MAVAQVQQPSVFDIFRNKNTEECVRVEYEFSTVMSGQKVIGDGLVYIQGNSYHMIGNGLVVYCNGATTWFVDEDAQEVIIESADSNDAGLLANPILLMMNLEESGVSYKAEGDSLLLDMSDGTKVEITIKSMEDVPTKKPEAFQPPVKFPKGWIVTDLR
jgi:hypothetical protein